MHEDTAKNIQAINRSRNKSKLKIILFCLLGLLLVASLAYDVYAYGYIQQMDKKVTHAEMTNKELQKRYDELKKKNATVAMQADAAGVSDDTQHTQVADHHDGNFVALSPNNGYLSGKNETTFEFTPHKNANKYIVELKFMGQESYPSTSPVAQTVTYDTTSTQPDRIKVTFNVPNGDYNWRVTAVSTTNGKDTILQSTDNWNYQVRFNYQ